MSNKKQSLAGKSEPLNNYDPKYTEALDHSIEEAQKGESLILFTMEDFITYSPSR
jgi:hypothetical protein